MTSWCAYVEKVKEKLDGLRVSLENEMRCEAHCSSSAFEPNIRYYRICFETRNIVSVEFLLVFKPVFRFLNVHRIRWRVFKIHRSINYLHDSLSIVSCIHSCLTYEHKEWRLTVLSVFPLIISQLIVFQIVFLELNLWEYPGFYEWSNGTCHGFELNTSTLRLNEFPVICGSRDHRDTKRRAEMRTSRK